MDTLKQIRNALAALLQRYNDDAFVIFEEETTGKFVQFAGSAHEDLLLDLPFQTLSETEVEKAKLLFKELDMPGPQKYAVYTDKSLEVISGIQNSFHVKFGQDVDRAAEITALIFERVYGFPTDFQLTIKEN